MPLLFLSYSKSDREAAQAMHERLEGWGYDAFIDVDGIRGGEQWERVLYRQLESAEALVFLGTESAANSKWCFAELTLARARGLKIYPLDLGGLERMNLLQDRQRIDLRTGNGAYERLEALLKTDFDPDDVRLWDPKRVPYPGLLPFRERDAGVFFGRDDEVRRLLRKFDPTLGAGRAIMVVGASGSGKSSLVRAGVLPRLRRSGEWVLVPPFKPGARPVEALARALAGVLEQKPATIEEQLRTDDRALARVVSDLGERDGEGSPVIITIDQAEELVVAAEVTERDRLLTLLESAEKGGVPLWVLGTLRSEFLDAWLADRRLIEFTRDQVTVGPIAPELLGDVILRPARKSGFAFDDGVVRRMIADTPDGNALPLLAYTLRELYERKRGEEAPVVTLDDYRAIGGVEGALSQQADRVQRSLERAGRGQLVLRTLMRLVTLNADDKPARQRISDDLPPDESAVVNAFVDARLLVCDEGVVDLAHEALLSAWPPLRAEIGQQIAQLRVRADLRRAAERWDKEGRPDNDYLQRDLALKRTKDLLDSSDGVKIDSLDEVERGFVDASVAFHDREHRTRRRLVRLGVVAAAVFVLGLAAATAVSVHESRQTDRQRKVADARRIDAQSLALASTAKEILPRWPAVAVPMALSAFEVSPRPEARSSLMAALLSAKQSGVSGILHGHARGVSNVAFSPDGTLLASSGFDRTVRLWDTRTHRQVAVLRGHTSFVNGIAFSPDGRTIASVSDDATIRLWDVRAGRAIAAPISGHSDRVFAVAFSHDGRTLASSSADKTIRFWDVVSRRQEGDASTGHTAGVYTIAYAASGRHLISSGDDATIRIWDVQTGREVKKVAVSKPIRVLTVSPDGTFLATGSDDHGVGLWSARTYRRLATFKGHTDNVRGVAFSPDGRTLASAGADQSVRLWHIHRRRPLGRLTGPTDIAVGVAFSPDGSTLAAASFDRTIRMWAMDDRPAFGAPLEGHSGPVRSVAFAPDGRTLASAGDDETVRLWDVRTRYPIGAPQRGHKGPVRSVAFSADGETVASSGDDGTIRLWDVRTQRPLGAPLTGHTNGITGLAFSPDGRLLATGSLDGTVRTWNARDGGAMGSPLMHSEPVSSIAFSPDSQTLASGGATNGIQLWDMRTGRPIGGPIIGHTSTINSLAFSPGGRRLASASSDITVRLWDVRKRRAIGAPMVATRRAIHGVAFSRDGLTLAAASDDKSIWLWDVNTRREVGRRLTGHAAAVNSVAFSPDGRTLASAGDTTVRVWGGVTWSDVEALRSEVCGLVGTGLNRAEWDEFAPDIPYHHSC